MTTQSAFQAALFDATALRPTGLHDGRGEVAGRRYDIYRNNIAVSLSDALATGFPSIVRLIGSDNFSRVAGVFLRQEPPRSPMMMHYGQGFPDFLRKFEPLHHLPYLADVARIDLAMRRSYHAADADPMDPCQLQGLSETDLMLGYLRFAPATILIRSSLQIHSIWTYTMRPDTPKPRAGAEDVLVARPMHDPKPYRLPAGAGTFVDSAMAGATFEQALAAAGSAFDLAATLSLLLECGALCALDHIGEANESPVRPA